MNLKNRKIPDPKGQKQGIYDKFYKGEINIKLNMWRDLIEKAQQKYELKSNYIQNLK